MTVRLLIADDHRIFLDGLKLILETDGEFEVVAEASNGRAALEALRQQAIDIAVLDVSMPELDGLGVVEAAKREKLDVRFVLLTMFDDPGYALRARDLGVSGFVLKEAASQEFLTALHAVVAGRTYMPSAMVDKVLAKEKGSADARRSLDKLTDTELTVLRELSRNKTSREIAKKLHVALRTVQNHRANMCAKLNLKGANRLLEFALEHRAELAPAPEPRTR